MRSSRTTPTTRREGGGGGRCAGVGREVLRGCLLVSYPPSPPPPLENERPLHAPPSPSPGRRRAEPVPCVDPPSGWSIPGRAGVEISRTRGGRARRRREDDPGRDGRGRPRRVGRGRVESRREGGSVGGHADRWQLCRPQRTSITACSRRTRPTPWFRLLRPLPHTRFERAVVGAFAQSMAEFGRDCKTEDLHKDFSRMGHNNEKRTNS